LFESVAPIVIAMKNAGPRIYAAVLVATLLLLLLPNTLIVQLGLTEFRATYKTYLGIALIVSASLLATHLVFQFSYVAQSHWNEYRRQRDTLKTLGELTEEEKELLRPFILEGQNTCYVEYSDGVVSGLERKQLGTSKNTLPRRGRNEILLAISERECR
jgi:hypothetical protein